MLSAGAVNGDWGEERRWIQLGQAHRFPANASARNQTSKPALLVKTMARQCPLLARLCVLNPLQRGRSLLARTTDAQDRGFFGDALPGESGVVF